jgi:hypothetical protein
MNKSKKRLGKTAVDDVRRIRERFSREAGGNVRKLAEQSQLALEQLGRELGLKMKKPDNRRRRIAK